MMHTAKLAKNPIHQAPTQPGLCGVSPLSMLNRMKIFIKTEVN